MRKFLVVLLLCGVAVPQTSMDLLTKRIAYQIAIQQEFTDMTLELSKLHDERANEVMRPHLAKILKLTKESQELK